MKTKIFFPLFIISLFVFTQLSGQEWLLPPYLDDNKQNHNFYDIQNAFNKWADGKDLKNVKGIKRYKRWEWFYEPRVYPTGKMPDAKLIWNESLKEIRYKEYKTDNSNWVSLSPAVLPSLADSSNIIGMGRINSITFHPSDTNTIWIGSSSGGVWKTTDDGMTWTCLTDDIPVLRVSDVAVDPNNTNILYVATGDINTIQLGGESNEGQGILKSVDGGITWDTTGFSFQLSQGNNTLIRKILVNPDNSNEIIAAGYSGTYKSYDGGQNWTQINSNRVIDLDVNPLDSNILYASTYYNSANSTSKRIYKSYDFGSTWIELNTGMPAGGTIQRVELAIAPSDTNYLYAITVAGNNGLYAIYKSTDAGQTWFVVGAVDTTGHPGAAKIPNLLGWGDGGMSGYMPDDGGQGTYDLTLVVDPHNRDYVYSGGVNMWGTNDGGTTWDLVSMWVAYFGRSIHADQHFSVFHPVTGKLYQAHDGGIDKTDTVIIGNMSYVYSNCIDWVAVAMGDLENAFIEGCYELPTQWTNITSGLHITEYYRLGSCKTNPNKIVAGAQDNGTFLYDNGTWLSTWGGDGMEAMIDHYNDNIIYATNYNGSLNKSYDGGYTYESGLDTIMSNAESGAWVTPYVMHPDSSETLYAGFENVWKSTDGGYNWSRLSDFPGTATLVALALSPSEPDSTIYCASYTNIYKTNDGGVNWVNIKNGLPVTVAYMTSIAVDANNPEHVWVTFSGYSKGNKVYESNDGGTTWTNISYNLPNVPVNTIVFENNPAYSGAIYVGTDIGVYYTNDSLRNSNLNWVRFSNNLPNVVVNELEIHYGAQKIRAATYGRGLWESPLYIPDFNNIEAVSDATGLVKVYPNPANEKLIVEANNEKENVVRINLFSLDGRKLYEYNSSFDKSIKKEISLSNLKQGMYIIQVFIGNSYQTAKFIKE